MSTLDPIGYVSSRDYITQYDAWSKSHIRNYSRRAFAKWAGIASSNFITLIISGMRPFQLGWLDGFTKAAKLSPAQKRYLKTLIQFEQARDPEEKLALQELMRAQIFSSQLNMLQQKELYLISSPDVWALYIGLDLASEESDQAVALKKNLNLKLSFIREVFKNFKTLDLVKVTATGRLEAKYKFVSTDNDYSRIENQKFHQKVIEEASLKLAQLPSSKRSYGSLTILLSDEDYLDMQKDIQNFGKTLLSKYGEGQLNKRKNILARINIQAYPLTDSNRHSITEELKS